MQSVFIPTNHLQPGFQFQHIAVDHNVLCWARALDWVSPYMKDYDNVQVILERMLPEAFFEHVHHTIGSLSQIIQDGLPSHDFIEAANWICPSMITVLTYMLHLVHGMTTYLDLDEVET